MAEMLLTIQHNGTIFSPPVKDDVQIEWERNGVPGRMTFTIVTPTSGVTFTEGDPVVFYYDGTAVFKGYVFTKSHTRERHIKVTCYDQLRYLKNKYTYVFENKTASQMVRALCADFGLNVGSFDNTGYVIPWIAEENTSAFDIVLKALEETLLNTGNMYVLYDNAGSLNLKNVANMTVNTVINDATAENFDYSSSIDDETYNDVVLYYKEEDNTITPYTATNGGKVGQWGVLRYFEEVKNKTIAQNKANKLLELYCKKTRQLTVKGALGNTEVRGGTLVPVRLNLGDITTNNFMLVEKVTHKFKKDYYTMDVTLDGAWED